MPKQLALLLCSGFVLYLLRCDKVKARNASWALWLPTIWMLVNASRSVDVWLGIGGSRESGGKVDPVVHIVLLFVGLIVLAKRRFKWSAAIRENVWLFLLVGFMLVSLIWSETPGVSLRRWTREFIALVMAFLVISERQPREAMLSLLRRTVYVLIPFSVLLIKYYQHLAVSYSPWTGEIQWAGVTLQKNGLGRLCLVSIFFLIWTFTRRWQKSDIAVGKWHTCAEVVVLIMALWLLRGPSMWAASATALCSLGLGLVTFFALSSVGQLRIPLGTGTWVAIVACIIGVGIVTPVVGGATVTAFTSAVGRDSTLTGRTDIWASLLPDMMKDPVLGYGFGSFWTQARNIQHGIGEAHNGYLEVLLGVGWVGLTLTIGLSLSSSTQYWNFAGERRRKKRTGV